MHKTTIAILGGVSAVALSSGANASTPASQPPESLQPARSFAELLDPIPNASALLEADNARALADGEASVQLAQVYVAPAPDYHHHHHHHYRRYHYYGYFPGYGYGYRHYYHHHHHHHHHYGVYVPLPE